MHILSWLSVEYIQERKIDLREITVKSSKYRVEGDIKTYTSLSIFKLKFIGLKSWLIWILILVLSSDFCLTKRGPPIHEFVSSCRIISCNSDGLTRTVHLSAWLSLLEIITVLRVVRLNNYHIIIFKSLTSF